LKNLDLDKRDQSEQHHGADESGNFVQAGASGHAMAASRKIVAAVVAPTMLPLSRMITPALGIQCLDDVRGDARSAGVAGHFGQLNGNDGEECGRRADKETCAEASGALTADALEPMSEPSRPAQSRR